MDELQEIICPVCATAVKGEIATCPRCETPHHPDCWEYAGGCAIFGCDSRGWLPANPQEWQELQSRVTNWNWWFRYHWIFYVLFTGGLLLTTLPLTLLLLTKGIMATLALAGNIEIIKYIFLALTIVATGSCLLGMTGYILLLIPTVLSHNQLEEKSGQSLKVPKHGVTDISERLTMPKTASVLTSVYDYIRRTTNFLIVFNILLALPILFGFDLHHHYESAVGISTFMLLLLRFFMLPVVETPMHARQKYLVTIQNRMLASFKGQKKDPTI